MERSDPRRDAVVPAVTPRRASLWATIVTSTVVSVALAVLSRIDYVAFHLTAEVSVVVVLVTLFAISWHTYRLSTNGYLTLMGMAALPISLLTLLHALTYQGMPILSGRTSDLPTQLWIAARYLTAIAFLIAPTFIGRQLPRPTLALGSFGAAALALAVAIFTRLFPTAFVQGQGLTPFKIASEYVIIGAFSVALWLLWRRRMAIERQVFVLLAAALGTSILAELLFTTYTDVYGITNMLGHLSYLLSFYLLYRALVETVLERPYDALFRELARNEAALREAHRFSEGLNEIDAAINSTLDPEEIFQRVVAKAGSIMGSDAAVLGLFEGGLFHPRYFWGYSGAEFQDITLDRDIGRHIFRTWELGRPLSIADTATNPDVSRRLVEATGARAILSNVLVTRDEPIGGLGFHWIRGPHEATPQEIDFARRLTASLSLALENARSYAAEHEVAEALQTDMASMAESVAGIEVGHVYAPAPGPGRLGGDFFDVFALDDERVAFLIGDVAGRGLAAAATNATTRSVVRALAYIEPEPDLVLRRASDALDHQLEDNEFVTAAFGVLDTRTGRARVSLFGHPGPLLAGKEDVVAPEDIRCPPLGVPIAAACPPWELTLETGDTLVLYTDGVLESRAGSEFFGSERLRSAISRAAGSPTAQGVADAALDAVRDFAEGKLSDDIAILALRYLGPAAVGEM